MARWECNPQREDRSKSLSQETGYFVSLLPLLLAAVSQQFFHMLILRHLGNEKLAERIKVVDDVDFVSAMRIMDRLVFVHRELVVAPHTVFPGACIASILSAETRMEHAISDALEKATVVESASGRTLIDRSRAPRQAYQTWLKSQPHRATNAESELASRKAVRAIVRDLLTLMEQTMLDAFCYWHETDPEAASTSWRVSGAAMMYLAALARLSGSSVPDNELEIGTTKTEARQDRAIREQQLIERCVKTARSAAYCCPDPEATKTLDTIANDCETLAGLRKNPAASLKLGSADGFRDFRNARRRIELA